MFEVHQRVRRVVERVFQRPYDPEEYPKERRLRRFHLRLTQEQLEGLVERMRELHEYAMDCKDPEGTYTISLTVVETYQTTDDNGLPTTKENKTTGTAMKSYRAKSCATLSLSSS